MRHLSQRLLAVAILLAWMAPGIGALSVGLHLAHSHHGHHGNVARLHADGQDRAHHGHAHHDRGHPENRAHDAHHEPGRHDYGHHEQAREIADLARAVVHGHHHGQHPGHHSDHGQPEDVGTAADHEHDARLSASTPLPRSLPLLAATHPSKVTATVLAEACSPGPDPAGRSPGPLFTVHCSLLL